MARVSNDLDVRQAMGLTSEAQQVIEGASWVILEAKPDYKYEEVTDENGKKHNKKTDTVAGTTILLGGPRKGDKLIRNKNMTVKLDQIWKEDDCNLVNDAMPEVRVKINRAVVWGKSEVGSKFVAINLSIHAELIDEDGQEFDPRNIKKDGDN